MYDLLSGFCGYFPCIRSCVEPDDPDDGFVVECNDGMYSQSGGERGAFSYHGDVMRPLYAHSISRCLPFLIFSHAGTL